MKKDHNLPIKNIQSNNSSGNPLQIAIRITYLYLLIKTITAEDLQAEGFHKIIHKTDIIDQIAKITNIAITTQDQTRIKLIIEIEL